MIAANRCRGQGSVFPECVLIESSILAGQAKFGNMVKMASNLNYIKSRAFYTWFFQQACAYREKEDIFFENSAKKSVCYIVGSGYPFDHAYTLKINLHTYYILFAYAWNLLLAVFFSPRTGTIFSFGSFSVSTYETDTFTSHNFLLKKTLFCTELQLKSN